jgi:CelD/BcsL family acetyltransferase involved in cellulose biosynthesis
MNTDLYRADAFDALADDWAALLSRVHFNTIFLTREWQRLTWQAFGSGELAVLAFREAGRLVGLAPLSLVNGVAGFAAYKEISDYLDMLVDPAHADAVHAALATWLNAHARGVSLTNIREDSASLTGLAAALRAVGWSIDIQAEDVCPQFVLPTSFDAYMDTLDGKERRELQRKLRRAAAESEMSFAADPATLDRDVDDFLTLMKASLPEKSTFMTDKMVAFFHTLAREMQQAGWLQLTFLEVGEEAPRTRAAAYLNFVYNNEVLVYNSGLDPARFSFLSPGQVLIARLIERAIAEGRSTFDFLQGNEAYKYRLGGKDVRVMTLAGSNPAQPG